MSLINQMLKDLEERTRPSLDPEMALTGLHVTNSYQLKRSRKKYILIVSLFFMSFIFFLLSYHAVFPRHEQIIHLHRNISDTLPKATTISANSLPDWHTKPATLTGITFQLQNQMTNIRFLLNQDSLYRINTEADLHTIVLILENTRPITTLPIMNYTGSAVQNMEMVQEAGGDLKIIFRLMQNAELQRVDLSKNNQLPELQIKLMLNSIEQPQKTAMVEQPIGQIKKLFAETAEEQYQQALDLSVKGQKNQAIAELNQLIEKYPKFLPARESLVQLLWQSGKQAEAEQVIKASLESNPFYPPFIKMKARMLVDQGKMTQALNLLQIAAPSLQQDPGYHALVAALYERQGQPQMAADLYKQLLALQPDNAMWWLGLGIALENQGKYKQAKAIYAKTAHMDGLNPELRAFIRTRMQGDE